LGYQNTGQPTGRPEKEKLELRPSIRLSPNVCSSAVLELAAKQKGLKNVGYLLDETASQLRAALNIPEDKIAKRAFEILRRLRKL
jgi:hypothetical protein